MAPAIVYLDTQDYSRFGDVLRGKGDRAMENLFAALEERRRDGRAIFAASMPLLGELLQYHPDYRETTLCKAEALERLCGPYALAYPGRLIGMEIAEVAGQEGLVRQARAPSPLSDRRFWYPNIAGQLDDMRKQVRDGLHGRAAQLPFPNRNARRRAKTMVNKADIAGIVAGAAPEMAAELGLPLSILTSSLIPLLQGKLSPDTASHRLFSAIAAPRLFAELYFERIETDRSLPHWIRAAGEKIVATLSTLQETVLPLLESENDRQGFRAALRQERAGFEKIMFTLGEDGAAEFDLEPMHLERIRDDDTLRARVPAASLFGRLVEAYILQILGYSGSGPKIEKGFAGDLIHALYLPHVDLWRGDRRFAALVKANSPDYLDRVIADPLGLPDAIDRVASQSAKDAAPVSRIE